MPEPSRHAGRVLIVDDDTILASLYRIKLQAAGFVVDVAETGEAGLLQIAQRQPDIVVLDLMLADMNGVDALRVLRQNPVTQRLPVIVFSSAFLGGLVEEAERVGATKCLNKGNTPPNRLIDEIRIILEPESVKGLSGVSAPVLALATPVPRVAPAWSPPPARPAHPPEQAPPPAGLQGDEIQGGVRRDLMDQIDQRIRDAAIALPKWLANPRNVQAPYLSALYRSIRAVAASARLAGRIPQGQLAGTLEVLLQEIKRMPDKITPSVLCTVAESVGLLPRLHGTSDEAAGPAVQSPLIAVVDDDENARAVLAVALEKAHLRAVCLATSAAALQVFEWNRVDLAILDLEMPGMDGAELAARMRSVPHNAATPVLFVSGRPDLEACATRSGSVSTHFIPKPFIGIELAVKALSILHARGSDAVLTLKRPLEERVA